ncbi:MAG: amidohydrolase [Chitinophagales bacterium]
MSQDKLIELRHSLHAFPEISCHETQTRKKIKSFLETHTDAEFVEFAGTALLAIFDSGNEGKNILFRAELDALPIQECNDFHYHSQVEGVSHMCGHDGHSTILCGLALKLQKEKPQTGKVMLIFQPAEENGLGAKAVMESEEFKRYYPDFIFALHNLPGFPFRQVIVRKRGFTAAVKTLVLKFHGITAHAAEPENGINPAMVIADIIKKSSKLTHNDPMSDEFQLITPVYANLGDLAYGISAGYGELHLTLRAWKQQAMNKLGNDLLKYVEKACKNAEVELEYEWAEVFASTENNYDAVDYICEAIEKLDLEYHHREYPFKWGEDFGLFTQNFKGAMFGLGAGEDMPALHNPDYDFPDELIETGASLFNEIRKTIQS